MLDDNTNTDDDLHAYNAFVAAQNKISKEEYDHFKSRYAATNWFGNVKIPF